MMEYVNDTCDSSDDNYNYKSYRARCGKLYPKTEMTIVRVVILTLVVVTLIAVPSSTITTVHAVTTNETVQNTTSTTKYDNKFCRAPNQRNESTFMMDQRYSNACKANGEIWDSVLLSSSSSSSTSIPSDYDNLTEVRSLLLSQKNRRHNNIARLRRQQENASNGRGSTWSNERSGDYLNGECGPHCRPSCITLQLNVNQLHQQHRDMIMCPSSDPTTTTSSKNTANRCHSEDTTNKCVHTRRRRRRQQRNSALCDVSSLYDQYPSCYLEDAKCFGPTLYDDITAVYKHRLLVARNDTTTTTTTMMTLPNMEHCAVLPTGDDTMNGQYKMLLYQRFRDWPMVRPIENVNCDETDTTQLSPSSSCFNRNSSSNSTNKMIYFEYCNIVEEDYDSCHACDGGGGSSSSSNNDANGAKCSNDECTKNIQPFPSGWTTFVVSASIPYNITTTTTGINNASFACNHDDFQYANETGVVCFVQRIELYYPDDCPYCHSCPNNVGLGDTFGPLEVIGFGHATISKSNKNTDPLQTACTPCNTISKVATSATTSLSCSQLQQCHESVDCATGTSFGIPPYSSNCSFQQSTIDDDNGDDNFVQEDSVSDDNENDIIVDDSIPDIDNVDETDDIPTSVPETKKPAKEKTNIPTTVPTTVYTGTPSIAPTIVDTMDPTDTDVNVTTTMPTTYDNSISMTKTIDESSKVQDYRLSPIIVTFIVIGLIIVISIQLLLYRQRVAAVTVQQQQQQYSNKNTEEIHYIEEPLEFEGIDKILSKQEKGNDGNGSQQTSTDHDHDNMDDNNSRSSSCQIPAVCNIDHRRRWGSVVMSGAVRSQRRARSYNDSKTVAVQQQQQQPVVPVRSISIPSLPYPTNPSPEIRCFQTASIVERSDQNEVEALYMIGQHHVP